jgi:hypothetical protein
VSNWLVLFDVVGLYLLAGFLCLLLDILIHNVRKEVYAVDNAWLFILFWPFVMLVLIPMWFYLGVRALALRLVHKTPVEFLREDMEKDGFPQKVVDETVADFSKG